MLDIKEKKKYVSSGFRIELNTAFGCLINSNTVTQTAHPSSELLALPSWYCKYLLKQSSNSSEEAEQENTPNQMVTVLRDLRDRCVSEVLCKDTTQIQTN